MSVCCLSVFFAYFRILHAFSYGETRNQAVFLTTEVQWQEIGNYGNENVLAIKLPKEAK